MFDIIIGKCSSLQDLLFKSHIPIPKISELNLITYLNQLLILSGRWLGPNLRTDIKYTCVYR